MRAASLIFVFAVYTFPKGKFPFIYADKYQFPSGATATTEEASSTSTATATANATTPAADETTECAFASVAEAATQTEDLSILVQAAQVAGLVDTLADRELTATVLAPTNAAFEALLKAANTTIDALLAEPELLADVLAYHGM